MKTSKRLYFSSELHLRPLLSMSILIVTLIFTAKPVFSQAPELFEEKVLLNNISAPWGFTFINNNEVLFTEKRGKIYRYVISTGALTEISGVPAISQNGQGGLLDIALHPNFSSNNFVYITYAVAATGGQTTALGRGRLVGNQLQNFTELFRALPIANSGAHFGSRIVFDRNNLLYMSVGDRGTPDNAQNKNNHLGKILRFNDDGTVPASNPLVGVPNTRPEIFCWGNRNIQGMAMNPATGEIYAHEHGPRGGDELNLIKPNTNYGWPAVTFGINYDGSPITPDTTLPGMELPLTYWVPSIAPSGMTFIQNGQPNNESDILIGALAGTHIHWLKMKDNKRVSSTRSMNGYGRFRDIRQAPDGKIYAMTESPNRFVLLRTNLPSVIALISPRDMEYLNKKTVDFQWGKSSNPAINYGFELALDKEFKNIVMKDESLKDEKTTVADLKNNTQYYWRVRAKTTAGWGDYSLPYSFQISIAAPKVTLVSPADKSEIKENQVTLSWNKTNPIAEKYKVQVSSDKLFLTDIMEDSTLKDTTKTLDKLEWDITMYWRVASFSNGVWGDYSDIYEFTAVQPKVPDAPTLVAPADNMNTVENDIEFSWSAKSSDAPALVHLLEISNSQNFDSFVFRDSNITAEKTVVKNLEDGKTFFWRMKTRNKTGWGQFSDVRSFSIFAASVNEENSVILTELSLFPNPSLQYVSIGFALKQPTGIIIEIRDINGVLVKTENLSGLSIGEQTVILPVKDLPTGNYNVSVISGDIVIQSQLIVIH